MDNNDNNGCYVSCSPGCLIFIVCLAIIAGCLWVLFT